MSIITFFYYHVCIVLYIFDITYYIILYIYNYIYNIFTLFTNTGEFLRKQETAVGLLHQRFDQLRLGDTCRCDSLLLKMRKASATCRVGRQFGS